MSAPQQDIASRLGLTPAKLQQAVRDVQRVRVGELEPAGAAAAAEAELRAQLQHARAVGEQLARDLEEALKLLE